MSEFVQILQAALAIAPESEKAALQEMIDRQDGGAHTESGGTPLHPPHTPRAPGG